MKVKGKKIPFGQVIPLIKAFPSFCPPSTFSGGNISGSGGCGLFG